MISPLFVRARSPLLRASPHRLVNCVLSWQDDHLGLRERTRPARAVDEGPADPIVATGKISDLDRDRLRRFRPVELNPAAAMVLAGVNADLEASVVRVGRHMDPDRRGGRRETL